MNRIRVSDYKNEYKIVINLPKNIFLTVNVATIVCQEMIFYIFHVISASLNLLRISLYFWRYVLECVVVPVRWGDIYQFIITIWSMFSHPPKIAAYFRPIKSSDFFRIFGTISDLHLSFWKKAFFRCIMIATSSIYYFLNQIP